MGATTLLESPQAPKPQPRRKQRAVLGPAPARMDARWAVEQPIVLYVDLFAGGGGSTEGALRAIVELGLSPEAGRIRVVAVNHDKAALATHQRNHPTVEHYDCDIERLDPITVLQGQQITLLWASAPCQDWSVAAGGPCKRPQQRATPAYTLNWIRIGRPKVYVEENVWEVQVKWPLWKQHVAEIEALGYRVEVRKLDAADHGVPQHRKRLILIAVRDDGPIAWPKPTHSDPEKLLPGTQPWLGAITALDLDTPCPSIFGRRKGGRLRPLSRKTRTRIARYVREQGTFWDPVAAAVEGDTGPVALQQLLESVPEKDWPAWIVRHGDHLHIHPAAPHLTKFYGTGRGHDAGEPSGSVTAQGQHLGVVQPQVVMGCGGPTGQQDPHTVAEPSPTVLTDPHLYRLDFTLGQQGGATPRPTAEPAATVPTAGYLRVGQLRCIVDYYGGDGKHHHDPADPSGALTCSDRWALADVGLLPPQGRFARGGLANPAHKATQPSGTVLAERGAGREVELRLATDKAVLLPKHGENKGQLPRRHAGDHPGPTVTTTHTPYVAFLFLYTYNGNANATDLADACTTVTTTERHAVIEVRLSDLYVDVGLRMLTVRELANLQSFPAHYVFLGRKEDMTRHIGNAVPPLLAYAVVKAALGRKGMIRTRLGDFEAAAA